MMKKIAIIGYGRFGKLLAQLCADEFDVYIVETDQKQTEEATKAGYKCVTIDYVKNVDYIFLAIPISEIENLLIKLSPFVNNQQVVIDICSVKVHPVKLMKKYLTTAQILGTHPMFGPDSAKKGMKGLQIAICPVNINASNLQTIKDFWVNKDTSVMETTPEDHDKDAAYSLAFTHTIAKIIVGTNIPKVRLTTRSFNDITEIAMLTAKDTDQLFHDMLFYNPYFPEMKAKLGASITYVSLKLNEIEDSQLAENQY